MGRYFEKIEDAVVHIQQQQQHQDKYEEKAKELYNIDLIDLDKFFAHVGLENNVSSATLAAVKAVGTAKEPSKNSKQVARSGKFEAGARCYAMFTNQQWCVETLTIQFEGPRLYFVFQCIG